MNDAVHIMHCCIYACKYGDPDCPVETHRTLPQYKCEGCTCYEMNADSLLPAILWWGKLSEAEKVKVYLENTVKGVMDYEHHEEG